jgi:hypothetical protein
MTAARVFNRPLGSAFANHRWGSRWALMTTHILCEVSDIVRDSGRSRTAVPLRSSNIRHT